MVQDAIHLEDSFKHSIDWVIGFPYEDWSFFYTYSLSPVYARDFFLKNTTVTMTRRNALAV